MTIEVGASANKVRQRTAERMERIERVITLVEHIWKTYPGLTFAEILSKAFGGDGALTSDISDEQSEATMREFLRRTFGAGRDTT